jgi:hypothetical protein
MGGGTTDRHTQHTGGGGIQLLFQLLARLRSGDWQFKTSPGKKLVRPPQQTSWA